MDCRRTVIAGGVLRSPPSASAAPLTIAAANAGVMRHRSRRRSRLYDNCSDDVVDDDHDECNNNNNNNNNNVTATSAPTINNTTLLVDELEQLRTDNFQLRLRVYNAERRVDKLSEAALGRHRKKRNNSSDTDSDTDTDDSSDRDRSGANNAAAKATAEAAVRTIHDLLTVNRRLLALLAATVSAKAVAVSSDDKQRWRQLQNHIKEYVAVGPNTAEKKRQTDEDECNDDEFHDASASDSETCRAREVSAAEPSVARRHVLHSPPPPPPAPHVQTTVCADDEGAGSEVSRLRGRCRRLERSLQQLVNTELWARNRQIGRLEQQRYVTQVADAAQRDRRPAESAAADASPQQQQQQQSRPKAGSTVSPPATCKGILVVRSAVENTSCSATAAATKTLQTASSPPTAATITTPPPVLPDYSEVNFFFSCDEEDDDDDHQANSADTNTLSSEEETADSNDEQPTRLAAVSAPVQLQTVMASNTRKRHCRPHHRQPQQPNKSVGDSKAVTTTTSSSTESAAEDEADDLQSRDGVITRLGTTVSGGGGGSGAGLHRRRRCRPPRRCSICGRCSGGVDAVATGVDRPRPPPLADAQVQCDGEGDVGVDGSCSDRGDGDQLQMLRRELDARRRENSRLYAMLLRLQRGPRPGDRGKGDGGPGAPSPDPGDSESDLGGSPEPYRQAAQAVRGRIADLLPPLLSMRSISDDDDDDDGDGGGGAQQRDRPDGAEQQQQQQQLQLLNRLRARIVAYERRELDGGDRAPVGPAEPRSADPANDAVRRMDRTDLVNVALPRALERLRQALVPLLQQRPESVVATASDPQQPMVCCPGVAAGGDGDGIEGARLPLIEEQ